MAKESWIGLVAKLGCCSKDPSSTLILLSWDTLTHRSSNRNRNRNRNPSRLGRFILSHSACQNGWKFFWWIHFGVGSCGRQNVIVAFVWNIFDGGYCAHIYLGSFVCVSNYSISNCAAKEKKILLYWLGILCQYHTSPRQKYFK